MCQTWGRKEMHTRLWCGSLKKRDHLRNAGAEERKMLKWIQEERAWAKFIWLRTGTSGLLWKR